MDVGELRVVISQRCWQTTFLDVITGATNSGQVLFGRNVRSLSEHQIARLGIGRKFQTPDHLNAP